MTTTAKQYNNLKLEDTLTMLTLRENVVAANSIRAFVRELAINSLDLTNMPDPEIEESFNAGSRYDQFDMEIEGAVDDTLFNVKFTATCELLYNECDESSVGLGSKGDLCGYDNAEIIIDEISFYAFGSTFDFSGDEWLTDKIFKELLTYVN